MSVTKLAFWMSAAVAIGSFCDAARAECSTSIQCIGISAVSPAEAEHNHHGGVGEGGTTPGSSLVTMDFSNRPVASAAVKTLYVAAAQGPEGTVVQLNPIQITGADANQFALVGGTCPLNGGNGPTHGATDSPPRYCTIEVRFIPTSPGVKTALLTVPFPQPTAGFIDHRDATLTGIGGNERISPALDSQVASLIASQVSSLRKFGAAQVTNISNRLASLHRARGMQIGGQGLGAGSPDGRGPAPVPVPVSTSSAGRDTPPPIRFPQTPSGQQPDATGAEFGSLPQMLASLLTARTLPLMLASDAGAEPGTSDGGYWLGGVATFGRYGDTGNETRFETSGLSAGADMRFGRDLVVGGAAGYSRAHNTFGTNGADSRNTGQSVALYGSYQAVRDVFVDAILGYGTMESQSQRYVTTNGAQASSRRGGGQVFGSLALTQDIREENLSWAPYARIEFGAGKLNQADETGAGIGSLTYLAQRQNSSRLSLGIRTSASHETEFGVVIPRLQIEYGGALNRVGASYVAYADQPGGLSYAVAPVSERRGSLMVAIGAEFLTHGGLSFGFELGSNGRSSSNPDFSSRLWLSTALDDRRQKPQGQALPSAATPTSVTAGMRYDDNVTRTGNPTPKLSDRSWLVTVGMDEKFEFSDSLLLNLGAQSTAEKFVTYDGLDNLGLGGRAELVYQAGGLFTAPRFGLFASAAYDNSRSDLRTGHRLEAGLSARMQVAERTGVSGVLSQNRRRARGDIYDTDFSAARIGIDQQAGDRGSVRLALEARRGDFVSSGRPMADSAAISEALADDDAFTTQRFVAYRFPAKSAIATLGYNLSLGSRDAFDVSWTAIRVTPTKAPDYTWFTIYPTMGLPGTGGNSPYTVQQIDIAYTMRF
jgi:uncharacterized protein YhjY with autotransporter beta-barrel domain